MPTADQPRLDDRVKPTVEVDTASWVCNPSEPAHHLVDGLTLLLIGRVRPRTAPAVRDKVS